VIRPPLTAGRVRRLDAEEVTIELTAAWSDGTYQIVLSPLELIEKLAALVLVEGHMLLGEESLRELMDVRIYVDVDPHERELRRMLRDTMQGSMTLEQAVAWYRRDVVPNCPTYTEAT